MLAALSPISDGNQTCLEQKESETFFHMLCSEKKVFHFKCNVSKLFLQRLDLVIIMKPCRINGKIFEWILISRRSCFRAGVRYYVRGKKKNSFMIFFFWCLLTFLFNAICVIQIRRHRLWRPCSQLCGNGTDHFVRGSNVFLCTGKLWRIFICATILKEAQRKWAETNSSVRTIILRF